MTNFWRILDERLELCHRALKVRHERLLGVKAGVAPILWCNGALARLKPDEPIDKLLYNDYSSISLGYAGLAETIYYMTNGKTQLDQEGHDFGIKVMKKINEACNKWKAKEHIGYSVYGTPLENTVTKFINCLKKRWGTVKGVTDHGYITNSFHINPAVHTDAFTKLKVESEFQKYSLGGQISYCESPNMTKNLDALAEIVKFISKNIMYAEINTMTSYCRVCGGHDIKMGDDLKFHCQNCGNDDFDKMDVALRVCGKDISASCDIATLKR